MVKEFIAILNNYCQIQQPIYCTVRARGDSTVGSLYSKIRIRVPLHRNMIYCDCKTVMIGRNKWQRQVTGTQLTYVHIKFHLF